MGTVRGERMERAIKHTYVCGTDEWFAERGVRIMRLASATQPVSGLPPPSTPAAGLSKESCFFLGDLKLGFRWHLPLSYCVCLLLQDLL